MEQKLVTIIIPVYNVEQYLDQAVQSAVDQTYRNLEIILVDDGSADQSGRMCDEWGKKDARIRVIHKANGGLSSARNAALDVCTGDYIFFLDSDDYLALDAIEIMLDDALSADADIVEAQFFDVFQNGIEKKTFRTEKKVLNTVQAIKTDLGGYGGAISANAKLYRRYIFGSYRFMVGRLYEEHFAIIDTLGQAKTVVIEPAQLYYYVHRQESITTKGFSGAVMDHLEAAKYCYSVVAERYPEALDEAVYRLDQTTFRMIDRIMLTDSWKTNPYLPELIGHIRKYKRRILKSRYMVPARKAGLIVLLVSPGLYRKIVRRRAGVRGI